MVLYVSAKLWGATAIQQDILGMMEGKNWDGFHNSCLLLMHSFCYAQKLVWLDVDRTGLINAVDLSPPPKSVQFL